MDTLVQKFMGGNDESIKSRVKDFLVSPIVKKSIRSLKKSSFRADYLMRKASYVSI